MRRCGFCRRRIRGRGIGCAGRLRRRPISGPWPAEVVGAAGNRFDRSPFDEHARSNPVIRRLRWCSSPQELPDRPGGLRERHHGSGYRPAGRCRGGLGRFLWNQRPARPLIEQADQIPFHIVRDLARAGACEVHTIVDAQPAALTVERRPEHRELVVFPDEAVPDIDVVDAKALRLLAQDLVDVLQIGRQARNAHRRQPDEEDRHALLLQLVHERFDAEHVELAPAIGADFVHALVVAQHLPVVGAEQDRDRTGLLRLEQAWQLRGPVVEIGADEAAAAACLLDDRDFGALDDERICEALRELVGERVADNKHIVACLRGTILVRCFCRAVNCAARLLRDWSRRGLDLPLRLARKPVERRGRRWRTIPLSIIWIARIRVARHEKGPLGRRWRCGRSERPRANRGGE